jgi:hypothetical protein
MKTEHKKYEKCKQSANRQNYFCNDANSKKHKISIANENIYQTANIIKHRKNMH